MSSPTIPKREVRRAWRRRRIVDVYRSDFLQDSGTPLQWLIAWEVVGEREEEHAAAQQAPPLVAALALAVGIPLEALFATLAAEA